MAVWAAVLDGVNDRATFPSVTTSNNIDIEVVITFNSLNGGSIIGDSGVANFFRYNAGTLRFRCNGFLGNNMSFTPVIGQKYTLRAELRPTGAELFVDGSSIGSGGGGTPTSFVMNTIGFFNSTFYLGCTIERLTVTDNVTSANSIDLYNDVIAGSSVNWPDQTPNNRDATLINTPTDGSQWLEVGGGVSVDITETGPSFTESISANLSPNIIVSISESGPSFTEFINANLSSLTIQSSIVESGPSFVEQSSLTVTPSLNINASISESGPSFLETSAVDLSKNISIAITENGPSFIENINTSIKKDITSTITEFGPSFNENITVKIPIKITLNPKNVVRVKRKSNTVKIKRTNNVIRVK